MSMFGQTLMVMGDVKAVEDLSIEGLIVGSIACEGSAVVVAATATVTGDIIARDVTIMGKVEGQVIATDVVDLRAGACVVGQVVSKRFIMNDGADFTGRVEPQHLEAALSVAKFQQKKRETA